MINTLADGGPFTWMVLAWAVILYSGIFNEIARRRGRYAPALFGAVIGQIALGLCATAVGLVESGGVAPELLPVVLSIAAIPTAVATALAAPAAVLVGVVATRGDG